MLLLSVFGLAALGMLGACACYIVLRFSIPDPWGAFWGLVAWAAVLAGTSLFIIQVVLGHISTL